MIIKPILSYFFRDVVPAVERAGVIVSYDSCFVHMGILVSCVLCGGSGGNRTLVQSPRRAFVETCQTQDGGATRDRTSLPGLLLQALAQVITMTTAPCFLDSPDVIRTAPLFIPCRGIYSSASVVPSTAMPVILRESLLFRVPTLGKLLIRAAMLPTAEPPKGLSY